ncbi:holin [Mycobacterium phage LilMcDreamy]|uniref:Holin n=1 Tax=Mycobacterium phage LilMcDreamy TaxID=2652422 RepID=A0A5P8D6J9_9CAUD|nr:holin [Mycobacterium phage LilMcDreamy]QFP94665.1 holin [Mycobacterium phage LilMcDreamy]
MTTSPIYTATAGPADPKAPLAQKFYAAVTAVAGLVGLASALGMITGEQAASLGQVSTTGTAFVAAVGTAVAAFRTKKQINNGTFDPAPDPVIVTAPPPISLENVAEVRNQLDTVINDAAQKAQGNIVSAIDALGGLTAFIPGGKPASEGLGSAVDLFQALSALRK